MSKAALGSRRQLDNNKATPGRNNKGNLMNLQVTPNTITARRDRAAYMRSYRKAAATARPDGEVTCPLCHEYFQDGKAYAGHFREQRLGQSEVHSCYTRPEMRAVANLIPDWDTGAWRVRVYH